MPEQTKGKMVKKIEVAANVAIIIVACLVVVLFIKNYRNQNSGQPHPITAGTRFALTSIDWAAHSRNIVLALSTSCHFCNESAGFYRELVKECQARGIPTTAVLPQSVSEAQAYLSNEGVTVNQVRQASLPSLEITGTPTLLLINDAGKVEYVWYGKLAPDEEKDVLAKLSR